MFHIAYNLIKDYRRHTRATTTAGSTSSYKLVLTKYRLTRYSKSDSIHISYMVSTLTQYSTCRCTSIALLLLGFAHNAHWALYNYKLSVSFRIAYNLNVISNKKYRTILYRIYIAKKTSHFAKCRIHTLEFCDVLSAYFSGGKRYVPRAPRLARGTRSRALSCGCPGARSAGGEYAGGD